MINDFTSKNIIRIFLFIDSTKLLPLLFNVNVLDDPRDIDRFATKIDVIGIY